MEVTITIFNFERIGLLYSTKSQIHLYFIFI